MVHKDTRREGGKIQKKGRGDGVYRTGYHPHNGHSHSMRSAEPPVSADAYTRDYKPLREYVPVAPSSANGLGGDGFVPFEMPEYRRIPPVRDDKLVYSHPEPEPYAPPEDRIPDDDDGKRRRFALPLIPPILILLAGLSLRNCGPGKDKPVPTPTSDQNMCLADASLAPLPVHERMVRAEILRVAHDSVGLQEGPDNAGPVEFTRGGKGPWCTVMSSEILRKAEPKLINRTASVWMFLQDAKKRGAVHEEADYQPIPGDVLITYDPARKNKPHTRIVSCVSANGTVEFISGNAPDPKGKEPDAVRTQTFTAKELKELRARYPESGYLNIGDALKFIEKQPAAAR